MRIGPVTVPMWWLVLTASGLLFVAFFQFFAFLEFFAFFEFFTFFVLELAFFAFFELFTFFVLVFNLVFLSSFI